MNTNNENQAILKVTNVTKSYQGKCVLDAKQITLNQGQIYGLIGPNGAGKSTLMRIISGLTQADSGNVEIFGEKFNAQSRVKLLGNMGIFIEGPSYYGHLSGLRNMQIIRDLKKLNDEVIMEALNIVDLTEHMHKQAKNYSLGMKQRLGLAMALAGFPKLLILDEPTNGLDPQGMEEMRRLIGKLSSDYGITVMISSHILGELEKIADTIGIIHHGKFLYQGSINTFKKQYSSEIIFKTSDDQRAVLLLENYNPKLNNEGFALEYVDNDEIIKLNQQLIGAGIMPYRIYDNQKSLESLFLNLTS